MVALLVDNRERAVQGANSRQRVCQHFDWGRTVDAYLNVYDELLGRSTITSLESTG